MLGGNRIEGFHTQGIELRHFGLELRNIHFVHNQQVFPAPRSQESIQGLIQRTHPLTDIHHEENEISLFHGNLSLLEDPLRNDLFLIRDQPACVDHLKLLLIPASYFKKAIPGYSRFIPDNGLSFAGEPIKQSGLTDVGSSDDGDSIHQLSSTLLIHGIDEFLVSAQISQRQGNQ